MGALWGSLAALSIGFSDLFGRRLVASVGAVAAAAVMQVVAILAGLATVLFVASEFNLVDIGWGALSGFGLAGGLSMYYGGLVRSSATVISPLVATLSAVIPFIYTLVRGSEASTWAILGAMVAFVGLAVIAAGAIEPGRLMAGIKWGVASGLSYGFGLSVLVEASDAGGSWPAVSQRTSAALVLALATIASGSTLQLPKNQRSNALIAGTLIGLTTVFGLIGLKVDAPPTVVTQSMFPVVSVVVGFVYFGDRVVPRQAAGIVLVLIGIVAVVTT